MTLRVDLSECQRLKRDTPLEDSFQPQTEDQKTRNEKTHRHSSIEYLSQIQFEHGAVIQAAQLSNVMCPIW
jgi:hypothetical protein